MSMTLSRVLLEVAEPTERHLPMPAWMFGLVSLLFFLVLLAVTFSFRHAGARYERSLQDGHDH